MYIDMYRKFYVVADAKVRYLWLVINVNCTELGLLTNMVKHFVCKDVSRRD